MKRAISSSHSALSEAGQNTSTRSMPLRRGQKLAGGDCLDALAEAHIVGQKGLFTLRDAACRRGIGQQRLVQQIEIHSAVLDFRKECRAPLRADASGADASGADGRTMA